MTDIWDPKHILCLKNILTFLRTWKEWLGILDDDIHPKLSLYISYIYEKLTGSEAAAAFITWSAIQWYLATCPVCLHLKLLKT